MKNKTSANRITKIKIQRFRSIGDLTIDLGRLTTLVGHNDAGKSNIVRALNLFFNNETSPGEKFNFESDFNKFSKPVQRKAKEIVIEITFDLPRSFRKEDDRGNVRKDKDTVKWRKVWRRDGFRDDKSYVRYTNGDEIETGGKIRVLLARYFLLYVPAIKDETFFTRLLGEIYDVLASSEENELERSGEEFNATIGREFNSAIQGNIQELLDNLAEIIDENDKFSITLPDNLRPIFENLKIKNKEGIPFERRGDGIKIKHVPEILNFITHQKENIYKRGVAPHHIWVFEEPENNLEFFAAKDMTERLERILRIRKNTQVLLTTHSPVFYGMELPNIYATKKHFIEKDKTRTILKPIKNNTDPEPINGDIDTEHVKDTENLDKIMGLMPLVDNYINVYVKREKELEEEIKKLNLDKVLDFAYPTIFVEGITDKIIIEKALAIFFPNKKEKIKVYSGKRGGAEAAAYGLLAWEHLQKGFEKRIRGIAILDDDKAGKDAIGKINNGVNNQWITWEYIKANGVVRKLRSKNYNVAADLESLYSDSFWEHAKGQEGWLTMTEDFDDKLPPDIKKRWINSNWKSSMMNNEQFEPKNFIDELQLSDKERLQVEYEFSPKGKLKAAKYIKKLSNADARPILEYFYDELKTALEYLARPLPQKNTQNPLPITPLIPNDTPTKK